MQRHEHDGRRVAVLYAFNSLFEMLGVLVLGFCGFLSFCVGVCRFLAEAC